MALKRLTEAEREEAWAEVMRELSRTRTVVGPITKFELKARLDALDDALVNGEPAVLELPAPVESNFQTRQAFLDNLPKLDAIVARASTVLDHKRKASAAAPANDAPMKGVRDGLR